MLLYVWFPLYKKNLTEILLSGQHRVLRGTIHPSTGDPRINIVGRARTPVLEVDCNKEFKLRSDLIGALYSYYSSV